MTEPTITLTCKPRSVKAMAEVFAMLDLDNPEGLYRPEDLDGDGHNETKCNWLVHDATALLGCPIPKVRARHQLEWLQGPEGKAHGWRLVLPVGAVEAANKGLPAVVGWVNNAPVLGPDGQQLLDEFARPLFRPSHIAVVRANPPGKSGVFIGQAGADCFGREPLIRGFGHRAPLLWFVHD